MNFNAITTAMSKMWLPPKLLFIMKLTMLLFFLALMQASAAGYSQISLNEKNVPLERVLQSIKKQTGYVFLYDSKDVGQFKMTIHVEHASIETVLKACSKVLPLDFKIVDNNVLLSRKEGNQGSESFFKTLSLKGKVFDENGQTLPGVSMMLSGDDFKQTTQTTVSGEYVFKVSKAGKYILTASFIGYKKYTMSIELKDEDAYQQITLALANENLSEVMVVAYGTQTKSSFTGSAKSLKADLLNGSPRASIQETLQGNVPGLISSNGSGQPGAVPNVRIRGIGSVNAGSGPLYVVDGIQVGSDQINSLNSFDIENVTVLKDASAASIYGSRAANGVILITTKSGFAGKTQINASVQFGANNVTPIKGQKPLNTTEMLELLKEGWVNKGNDPSLFQQALKDNAVDPNVNTDWFDLLTRTGNYRQVDLSASGGTEKTKFYVSGSNYVAKAALLGSDFSRSTANLRLTNQATEKLSFSGGIQLSYRQDHTQADAGTFGNPVRMYSIYQPWLRAYNDDGTYDFSYFNRYNPVAQVKESFNKDNFYGVLGNFLAKYQILPSLSIENQSNINFVYEESIGFNKSGVGTSRTDGGRATSSTARSSNWVNTTILRYNKNFGDFGLKTYLGYEAQKVNEVGNSVTKRNFLPNTYTLDNASILVDGGSNETANSLNSIFFNASIDYNSKYYLSASVRRDGSSRFGTQNIYGNFWALGASWNITKEDFMSGQTLFSDLRLRTSYGVNGNQDIGNFVSRALYNSSSYDNAPGLVFSNYGNNLLTWEKNKPFNLGLDFGVLRNRLTGTVEYYTRATSDLLLSKPISATNGLTSYMDNIGAMKNSGFELELNSVNVKSHKGGFGWTTSFNISTMRNKITALSSPIISGGYDRYVGGDFYQLYLVGYAGVDPQNGEALWYTDKTKTQTTNKYGSATQFDQGSALPDFFGGLTNTFTYKGFSLSFQFYFNYGNKIYDNWGATGFSDGSGGFSPTTRMPRYTYDHRWQKPGDITDQPKIVYTGTQSGTSGQSSTRFLYDGDYIRLRDVSLGYQLPDQWMKHLNIASAKIYFRANNLFTYIKDKRINFDPEVGIDGLADKNAPVYKTALIGLDLKF
ncbi:SusC/RagA family TonB-linked outer membrane protein [Pedobacter sp. HMWF019]|uniref:SusC/RagA family TonB-linked outer membrane protein n=1 Tax=Pedobacter sp. HMWF019 TaxID=2056856 RepID=UPI000D3D281D|nr:SusC/RagA family TonB-linked outer membrane protein [Pedobacter sp. HMWF019]PTS97113.1 SusC/RagA family TonB-linked outer membrane protein [Pedobacter sp. HMWF019]